MIKSFTFGHLHHSKEPVKLPVDVATECTAFIGRRGSGKSHGARVVVEGVLDAEQQVVVFDPLNIWWGLRLKKDGKTAAYNVYIFGGDHADQPLVEQSGPLIADFVIDTGSSVVLSMRHLSKAAMRRFVADFNERLMERKQSQEHRNVLLVVLDESDLFVPQRLQPEATRCFGVVDDLIRRGRASGIGTLMLSQRPAVINKDVLAMTEIMVCLQVVSPQDRKALLAWVEANATDDKAEAFTGTLPTLKRGEAIVWSPSLLNIFERILIKDTSTYDSSYTPKVGEKSRGVVKLKPVDLAKLTEQLQAVAKESEENKPAKLKARIKDLEKRLVAAIAVDDTKKGPTATEIATGMVEKTLKIELEKRDRMWSDALGVLKDAFVGEVATLHRKMAGGDWAPKLVGQKHPHLGRRPHGVPAIPRAGEPDPLFAKASARTYASGNTYVGKPVTIESIEWNAKRNSALAPLSKYTPRPAERLPYHDHERISKPYALQGKPDKAERKVLLVLAHYGPRTKAFVAAHAGYSVNTGHFSNVLGALRASAYIENTNDGIMLTGAGREYLGPIEDLPTGEELWQHWMSKLGKGERAILEQLRKQEFLTKEHLGQLTGYSHNTGHFSNCLGALRGLNLIEGSNPIQLTPEFKEVIS